VSNIFFTSIGVSPQLHFLIEKEAKFTGKGKTKKQDFLQREGERHFVLLGK
jgi:hypothetical protein